VLYAEDNPTVLKRCGAGEAVGTLASGRPDLEDLQIDIAAEQDGGR